MAAGLAPARGLVRLFADVGFGVSLLALWGLLTLLGVLVDQGKDAETYFRTLPPELARIVLRLGLDHVYHSIAYVTVIGLILCSMWTATFVKVIPRRIPRLAPVRIEAIPLHAWIDVDGEESVVRERVAAFFDGRGYQVRKRAFGGTEWTFADKHNWARRGVILAHIGFLIIAIGTTIYWARGFDGSFAVVSGKSATIPQTGTQVALRQFGYRIDPVQTKSGIVYQPIDYVSQATVIGPDGVPHDATIRVNQPYDAGGTLIYQATYGFAIDFRLTKDGRDVPLGVVGPLKEGEGFPIAGTDRAIQYTHFIGTLDRRTMLPAPDPRPNDPAVQIEAFQGDRDLGGAIVPLGGSLDLGAGWRLAATRYTLYSGFQYRNDPGIPVVGLGALILVLGLCISVYVVPARFFVRLEGAGRAWRIGIAATTVKGYEVFEERFTDLVAALRRDAATN